MLAEVTVLRFLRKPRVFNVSYYEKYWYFSKSKKRVPHGALRKTLKELVDVGKVTEDIQRLGDLHKNSHSI